MQNKVFLGWFVAAITAWAMLAWGDNASAGQFTADMVLGEQGKITTSKIYVKDSKYRMELEEEDHQFFVIVDQSAGITLLVAPDEKMYMEMPSNDPQSLMNDPFQGLKYAESMGDSKHMGTVTINGYECDKYVISMRGEDVMTQWISQNLEFPIKIVVHDTEDKYMELKNIQEKAVDDGLFQIPSGYTKRDESAEEEIEVPDWAEQILSAPVMKPPFELDMSAGEIIRVEVESGKAISVRGENKINGESAFSVVPFLNGRPIMEPSMGTLNLAGKGMSGSFTRKETTREANEIVIRVRNGEATISVETIEMVEHKVSTGEELRVSLEPDRNIEARFVNLIDGESVCICNYFEKGEQLSDENVGPIEYRTITLKNENDVEKQTWRTDADEVILKVEKGEMLIKLGQP